MFWLFIENNYFKTNFKLNFNLEFNFSLKLTSNSLIKQIFCKWFGILLTNNKFLKLSPIFPNMDFNGICISFYDYWSIYRKIWRYSVDLIKSCESFQKMCKVIARLIRWEEKSFIWSVVRSSDVNNSLKSVKKSLKFKF